MDAEVPAARLRALPEAPHAGLDDGLDRIDFDKIMYYRKPSEREEKSWDDVPDRSRPRSSAWYPGG